MNTSVLQQAAVEASAALEEIEAEIDQLESRKEFLQAQRDVLDSIGRQLCTVLSMIDAEASAVEAQDVAPAPEPVLSEAMLDAAYQPESAPEPAPRDEVAATDAESHRVPDAVPTFADLASLTRPFSQRAKGWPSTSTGVVRMLRESF